MTEETQIDGRRQRSLDSRARIVSAMLALVMEGEAEPSADQVAARAGVGLRSVFRHFEDMDSLFRHMGVQIEAELNAVAQAPFLGRTWRDRVIEVVGRRAVAFERIAPFLRAVDLHRKRGSADMHADGRKLAAALRAILTGLLPAEAQSRHDLVETLDLLLSYEAWARLREQQDLSETDARAVLEAAVKRLLDYQA